ncbi:MAG TPA: ATP-binding protein [Vicinamibacterales bacterium]|nr:ATP-binding protein [Vicinamibacterales bacterium]
MGVTRRSPPDTPTAVMQAWQRLRFALGAAGIGSWHLDLQSRTATYDDNLNALFGLEPVETTAALDDRLTHLHPDDRERVRRTIDQAIAARAEFTTEFRIIRPDGTIRWLRDRGRILIGDRGEAIAATGAVMDITDRHRVEEHERLLTEIMQAQASGRDIDPTLDNVAGVLVPRFAAACTFYLRDRETVVMVAHAGPDHLVAPEQPLADAVRSGIATHAPHELILPLRAKGVVIGAVAVASPERTFDAADASFATEVADRVGLAVDHARLFRDLERANRVKNEFLATLSHELRTPLNAVLGWTRMLRRGAIPAERTPTILETIERNASAQVQLVEELLDLSAMAAGGLKLTMTQVDLRDLVGGAIETVRPAADAKSLRLTLSIADDLGEVAGDPARLRQVLWNLLTNAVKFTPPGGRIELSVTQGPVDIQITVRDSGPGIATDFLPHVFEPFRQGDSGPTRSVGGLGLGLAIVRHIVEAHGGTCVAHSDGQDRGSTFSVRLPTGRTRDAGAAAAGDLRGRRVLAVDDDESTQELVAAMLLLYGVSVRTAGQVASALQILSEWRPDVLLADIAMPGEDGYAMMRRVRALPPPLGHIPAVALTGYTDPQSVQAAFAAGFDAHLGKPLEPHVLADALSKVLRLRRR